MSIREFKKSVCCNHSWAVPIAEYDGCSADDAQDGVCVDVCQLCGAKCERDKGGRIVDFDALWNWGKPLHIDDLANAIARAPRSNGQRRQTSRRA